MHAAVSDLIAISNSIGNDITLVQGGGGNTSVKADGAMYIKASGTPLKGMNAERGWVQYGDTANPQQPSMEWPMHLLLPRVVMHAHAVYANLWLCAEGGLQRLGTLLAHYQPVLVPYTTPGQELADVIQAKLLPETRLILLENHGVIVCAAEPELALSLMREINWVLKGKLEEWLPNFQPFDQTQVVSNPTRLPSLFPDAAVFEGRTDLGQGALEIMSANAYLHRTIQLLGNIPQPLPAGEGQKLLNMEQEQYRIKQL